MNTFFGCVLLAIICRSFVKLLAQGIKIEEEEDNKEDLIIEYDE